MVMSRNNFCRIWEFCWAAEAITFSQAGSMCAHSVNPGRLKRKKIVHTYCRRPCVNPGLTFLAIFVLQWNPKSKKVVRITCLEPKKKLSRLGDNLGPTCTTKTASGQQQQHLNEDISDNDPLGLASTSTTSTCSSRWWRSWWLKDKKAGLLAFICNLKFGASFWTKCPFF